MRKHTICAPASTTFTSLGIHPGFFAIAFAHNNYYRSAIVVLGKILRDAGRVCEARRNINGISHVMGMQM